MKRTHTSLPCFKTCLLPLLVFLILAPYSVSAEEKQTADDALSKAGPRIHLQETEFDFGTIEQGQIVSHIFLIANTGDEDLVIERVKTSCGCTAAKPDIQVIAPGKSTELAVSFNSGGRNGAQKKQVAIYTNDPSKPRAVLIIKTRIHVNILIQPQRMYFKDMSLGESRSETLEIKNQSGEDFQITGFQNEKGIVILDKKGEELVFPILIEKKKTIKFRVDFTYPDLGEKTPSYFHKKILVHVEGKEKLPLGFSVVARTKSDR